ncbi:BolA/IbaG family iron-sulfur metabolism protein [Haliangium sp.]|uniref:BolA/IbaG family iron-sulfur metabolism protein n=1 Tax=Haliangium sp. TaxID=2663208 RepID=UPI003D131AC0
MSVHLTTFEGSVTTAIRDAILQRIDDAEIEVSGGGGHFNIVVRSGAFTGRPMLQNHRLVMGAIAHLMEGESAPVHAVDKLQTLAK